MVLTRESARGELDPTPAYDRRAWRWEPAAPGEFADDRDATLTILLTHVGRRITRTTIHEYAVQVEWDTAADFGLAAFLLENEREPDEDGPIRCVVGGMCDDCSCEAGRMDKVRRVPTGCKHRAALLAILSTGVI